MGLFTSLRNKLGKRLRRTSSLPRRTASNSRICRFEPLETRQYLSATPLNFGAVYLESGMQSGQAPNQMSITFDGGPAGTQLNTITIDVSKGSSASDIFFHTTNSGPGTNSYPAYPVAIVNQGSIGSVTFVQPADGSTVLTLQCTNFVAGDVLTISFGLNQTTQFGPNPTVNGAEFSGTILTGQFSAPNYKKTTGTDTLADFYDSKLVGTGLNLPPDDNMPPATVNEEAQTAGAVALNLMPNSIAGTVYVDNNLNNVQDTGEPGLSGVSVTLYELNGSSYTSTGETTLTDANGNYAFTGLTPGTYEVVKTSPSGYFDVGASAGNVGGQSIGTTVLSPDILSNINLGFDENTVQNNFGEAKPAQLSGYVYYDANDNGVMDTGEKGIAGVSVTLLDSSGNAVGQPAVTDATISSPTCPRARTAWPIRSPPGTSAGSTMPAAPAARPKTRAIPLPASCSARAPPARSMILASCSPPASAGKCCSIATALTAKTPPIRPWRALR